SIPAPSSQSPPPPEPYTLSLHDALPISTEVPHRAQVLDQEGALSTHERATARRGQARSRGAPRSESHGTGARRRGIAEPQRRDADRKSTRLNSSHVKISYAVFCLKKKRK